MNPYKLSAFGVLAAVILLFAFGWWKTALAAVGLFVLAILAFFWWFLKQWR